MQCAARVLISDPVSGVQFPLAQSFWCDLAVAWNRAMPWTAVLLGVGQPMHWGSLCGWERVSFRPNHNRSVLLELFINSNPLHTVPG